MRLACFATHQCYCCLPDLVWKSLSDETLSVSRVRQDPYRGHFVNQRTGMLLIYCSVEPQQTHTSSIGNRKVVDQNQPFDFLSYEYSQ